MSFVVEIAGSPALLECKTPGACLSVLRRGGARLVLGDREALLRLLAEQEQSVLRGLGGAVSGEHA